jgi:hypothetical protein
MFFRMALKSKMIAISKRTHHNLAQMGTLGDTFDSVIDRMIQREKAASAQDSLERTKDGIAAAPLHHGGQND